MRYIVTTGHTYADIDALACVFAYHELLLKEGKDSLILLQGVWNHSIPQEVHKWGMSYQTRHEVTKDDRYVVMDTSHVQYIQEGIEISKITELYDHHFGYEEYW